MVTQKTASGRSGVALPVTTLLIGTATLYASLLAFDFLPFLGGRSVALPFAALFLTLYLIELLAGRIRDFPQRAFVLTSVPMLAWTVTTTLWSASAPDTLVSSVSLAFHIFLVFGLYCVMRYRKSLLLWSYVHGTTAAAVGLLLSAPNAAREGRASVGGVDENGIALALGLGFAAACYLAVFETAGTSRILVAGEMLLIGLATAHSGSRTGIASIILVIGTAAALAAILGRAGKRITAIVSMLLIAGCTYFAYRWGIAHGYVPERVVTFIQAPELHDPSRNQIIDQYRQFIGDWEFFGVGYGADVYFILERGAGHNNAHSLFWKTWIETGFLGLLLVFGLIASSIWAGVKNGEARLVAIMWAGYAAFAWSLGGDRTDEFWWMIALSITPRLAVRNRIFATRGANRTDGRGDDGNSLRGVN